MAEPAGPLDLWKSFQVSVYEWLGIPIPGWVAIAVCSAAFFVYREWDKVRKWPGVHGLLGYLSQPQVPHADPTRFSVLVAYLENDPDDALQRLIIEGLTEFEGIQVVALNRLVRLKGAMLENQEARGRKSARRYLRKSGASVLIWGTVLIYNGNTVPKLYWTGISVGTWKTRRYDAPRVEDQLRLPEIFWADLAEVLKLLVVSHDYELRAEQGRYVADQLPPFIVRTRNLVDTSANRPGWDENARGTTRMILADVLQLLGHQAGENEPLRQAIDVYRAALKDRTRGRVPLDWAKTQNYLGNALFRLGEREEGTDRLKEALAAYRAALQERTPDRVPLDWATTQNNVGAVLVRLGEREGGAGRLEEAIVAFRKALEKWTREQVPLDWACAQSNLGAALARLGEREGGTGRLEEAIVAFRKALEKWTREQVPLDWADAQNNLGWALRLFAERKPEEGAGPLEEAITACREALKERSRERTPVAWAGVQHNLGLALRLLGEREEGTGHLMQAVAALEAACEALDANKSTYDIQRVRADVQRAEALLRKRRNRSTV